jgi:hypothetical protein
MLIKKIGSKELGICIIVGTICILLGLWIVLMMPETALAAKPGNIPVCIEFLPGGGIQSDDYDDDGTPDPYCDDKKLSVEAIMTPDGHVNLYPNTGRGDRTLNVNVDFEPDNPYNEAILTKGWRFLVGGWQDTFDMRDMEIGEESKRTDVNLMINTEVPDNPPNGADGLAWRLIFDPSYIRWDIDYSDSTFITVTRISPDMWEIDVDSTDRAVLVLQKPIGKNKSDFVSFPGLVSVPSFTAIVTLTP